MSELQLLERAQRDEYIKKFRKHGLSIRQISRLTGISKRVIEKIGRQNCPLVFERRYNELVEKYDSIKVQVDELNTAIADKKARKAEIELFVKNLKAQDRAVIEFDEGLWISMVDSVMVYAKDDIRVEFKNGSKVKV